MSSRLHFVIAVIESNFACHSADKLRGRFRACPMAKGLLGRSGLQGERTA